MLLYGTRLIYVIPPTAPPIQACFKTVLRGNNVCVCVCVCVCVWRVTGYSTYSNTAESSLELLRLWSDCGRVFPVFPVAVLLSACVHVQLCLLTPAKSAAII